DIVDLVGRHVGLKKAGRTWKGLCPFHHEKTPSFVVSPERGTFHCFGCGEGGNAFAFLVRHENLTFPEAVRSLGAELGIEVPDAGGASGERLAPLYQANQAAQALYREALHADAGREARAYLARRGIDRSLAERFGIGFAPDRWDAVTGVLARERIPAEAGERAGVLKRRERGGHYDLLRGRVTFPIHDVRGRVVGFGGRALAEGQEPKYLNTPESPVFRKRESFYGFPAALEPMRRADRAVVVEGYFDLIALHRAGIGEAVATCGTALTEEHARNLRRRTRNVVLLFDGDEAGQKAMGRALEVLLPQGLRVRAAVLPPGLDPDDLLAGEGPEALARRVDAAPPARDRVISRAAAAGVASPWERADAVDAVVPLLVALPDPVERGEWARRLAVTVGTEPADVDAAVRRAARGRGGEPERLPAPPRRLGREDHHFARLLRVLIERPEFSDPEVDARLRELAPDPTWAELATRLHGALAGGGARAAEALLETLEGDLRGRLSALLADDFGELGDLRVARRVLGDTLAWLARRRDREARADLTRRLATHGEDPREILAAKQRELARRRTAARPPGHAGITR
ncbi:MAG: DNA primase, partial [Myxococcota bacterium]|nr:DNA primase [Myxococcota bacterium]